MARFDALWLASYGDERASLGRCEVRADLQRPLAGPHGPDRRRRVRHRPVAVARPSAWSATPAGAAVLTSGVRLQALADARGPSPPTSSPGSAWRASWCGYGMDAAGALRGLPYIGALD